MRISILITTIVLSLALAGCQNSSQNIAVATVQAVKGSVAYHPASSDEKIALMNKDSGRSLYHLDKLVVGEDSFLHVQLGDEGELFAEPGTTLLIEKPKTGQPFDVFVNLVSGVLNCFIEKRDSRFAVKTPTTVAGVLGTRFQISVEGQETTATLVESEQGLGLQSLDQDLNSPIVLKTSKSAAGAPYGAALTLSEPLTMENQPRISEGIRTVENIQEITYPVLTEGGIQHRSYLDYGVRTTTVER